MNAGRMCLFGASVIALSTVGGWAQAPTESGLHERTVTHGFNPLSPRRGPRTHGARGATVLYVDDTAASGGDGSSWASAYRELQQALADAANDPAVVEIRVAAGIYRPDAGTGDRNAEFLLLGASNLALLGGFPDGGGEPEDRDPAAHETVLSGDLAGDDLVEFEMLEFDDAYEPVNPDTAGVRFENISDNSFTVIGASGADETVVVDGFTVTGGHDPDRGGGLIAAGAGLVIRQIRFIGNSAGGPGGAVFLINSTATIIMDACAFEHNSAVADGGAIYLRDSWLTLEDAAFAENAGGKGGGIGCFGTAPHTISISDARFERNLSLSFGGAIANNSTTILDVRSTQFIGNAAVESAGAVYGLDDNVFEEVEFVGNTAGANGGGLRLRERNHVTACQFSANAAATNGGGAYMDERGNMLSVEFTENVCGGAGGGLSAGVLTVTTDSRFVGNRAVSGGGASAAIASAFTNCVFESNRAFSGGGVRGIDSLDVRSCRFTGNIADGDGGGLWMPGPSEVVDTLIENNSAMGSGGGIWTNDDNSTVDACFIVGNYAGGDGGGYWMFRQNSLTNSVVVGNEAGGRGGGVGTTSDSTIRNSTILANQASEFGGVYVVTGVLVTDSVIWDNSDSVSPPERAQIGGAFATVDHTIIMGLSDYFGSGNLGLDPMFVDPVGADGVAGTGDEDLRLSSASPGIDAGSRSGVVTNVGPFDAGGRPRFVGFGGAIDAVVDMGAYEAQDCDQDGLIDSESIAQGHADDCNGDGVPDACQAGSFRDADESKFFALDAESGADFGIAIAMSDDRLAVGAWRDDGVNDSGAAYLFDIATGQQIAKLEPVDGQSGDDFGLVVAAGGGVVAVGARGDDDFLISGSGSVYLYDSADGTLLGELHAPDAAAGDSFGSSLAYWNGYLAVGAVGDDDRASESGAVYLFELSTGLMVAKMIAADGQVGDQLGVSVAMADGVLVAGAERDDDLGSDSGSAYLFAIPSGIQLGKLRASDGVAGDSFGGAVAVGDGRVAVGARRSDAAGADSGAVYLFDSATGLEDGKVLAFDGAAGDAFGHSVAILNGVLAIGAPWDDDFGGYSGSVYLHDIQSGGLLSKMLASGADNTDYFGTSVALDAGVLAVGARQDEALGSNTGTTYLYVPRTPDADGDGIPDDCVCPADFNADGMLDFFDVQSFLAAFASHDDAADFNADGLFDFFDVQAYLNAYAQGCS